MASFSDELYHYGVKGMKWGVRRTPEQLGHKTKFKPSAAIQSTSSVASALEIMDEYLARGGSFDELSDLAKQIYLAAQLLKVYGLTKRIGIQVDVDNQKPLFYDVTDPSVQSTDLMSIIQTIAENTPDIRDKVTRKRNADPNAKAVKVVKSSEPIQISDSERWDKFKNSQLWTQTLQSYQKEQMNAFVDSYSKLRERQEEHSTTSHPKAKREEEHKTDAESRKKKREEEH